MPRGMMEILCTGSQPGCAGGHQGVAHLVVGDHLPLPRVEQPVLLLEAGDDPLDGGGEVVHARRVPHPAGWRPAPPRSPGSRGRRPVKPGGERGHLLDLQRRGRAPPSSRAPPGSARVPIRSGRSTSTCRSKRPARRSAGSRISGPVGRGEQDDADGGSKPSSSAEKLVQRLLLLVVPAQPGQAPRARPSASSSSMKMTQGALSRACSNRSRTRAAPTPTNISTNSEPLIEKNGHRRLARHRPGEQRLAGARRADEEDPLRHARAEPAVGRRVLEEGHHLLQLFLRLVDAGDIREGAPRHRSRRRPWPCTCRWR